MMKIMWARGAICSVQSASRMERARSFTRSWGGKKIWQNRKKHGIICLLSHRYLATGGGVHMEVAITFLVTVAAGVACHYIIKWLDRDHKGNK